MCAKNEKTKFIVHTIHYYKVKIRIIIKSKLIAISDQTNNKSSTAKTPKQTIKFYLSTLKSRVPTIIKFPSPNSQQYIQDSSLLVYFEDERQV